MLEITHRQKIKLKENNSSRLKRHIFSFRNEFPSAFKEQHVFPLLGIAAKPRTIKQQSQRQEQRASKAGWQKLGLGPSFISLCESGSSAVPCCAGSMQPSATLSNWELMVTLPWVRLWENGKEKTGKGGKQHSWCCWQSQASPLATAGLVKVQLVCASSRERSLLLTQVMLLLMLFIQTLDTTQNNPAKANTRVLTYRTWVDNTIKVVNGEKHGEISYKVPASELFWHLKNQISAFWGKKRSQVWGASKISYLSIGWCSFKFPWLSCPSSSEDHCSLSSLGSSFDCVLLSC